MTTLTWKEKFLLALRRMTSFALSVGRHLLRLIRPIFKFALIIVPLWYWRDKIGVGRLVNKPILWWTLIILATIFAILLFVTLRKSGKKIQWKMKMPSLKKKPWMTFKNARRVLVYGFLIYFFWHPLNEIGERIMNHRPSKESAEAWVEGDETPADSHERSQAVGSPSQYPCRYYITNINASYAPKGDNEIPARFIDTWTVEVRNPKYKTTARMTWDTRLVGAYVQSFPKETHPVSVESVNPTLQFMTGIIGERAKNGMCNRANGCWEFRITCPAQGERFIPDLSATYASLGEAPQTPTPANTDEACPDHQKWRCGQNRHPVRQTR